MGELTIANGLATILRAMADFADAAVVLNDWTILDQSSALAPYAIITSADDFTSRMDTASDQTVWMIPVTLYEYFTDWTTALNGLRERRQAVLDAFNNATSARSAGGLDAVSVNSIRAGGPITPYYPPYTPTDQIAEATPVYLWQTLIFECEEF